MKVLGMGVPELIIILIVILLIFGPKNLPKLGSALGKTVSNLRSGMNEGKKKKDDEGSGAEAGNAGESPEGAGPATPRPAELEGEVEEVIPADAKGEEDDRLSSDDEPASAEETPAPPSTAPRKVKRVVKKKVESE